MDPFLPDHPDIVSCEKTGYPRAHWYGRSGMIDCDACGHWGDCDGCIDAAEATERWYEDA